MRRNDREGNGKEFAESLNNFIYFWHQFPIDYWWRKKYNVPFNSPQHREMNLIDIYLEYQEENLLKQYRERQEREKDEAENRALKIDSNKEVIKMSKKEIDEDYENLDLSQFDIKENE